MSPRIKKKLALALVLVTIILIIPPAHANDPCVMSCDYEYNLCMESHQDCTTNAYYNYYNCQQMYPPESQQGGVCNYNFSVDMQTCDQMMYDCNFSYDMCLTSCQYR